MAIEYNTDRARWDAVLKRDRVAGNAFVYTVSSTGIYCRPTCPARVARRANVGFYDHASEAVAAGFRPCKRCKPEVAEGQPEDAAITAVKAFVARKDMTRSPQTLRQMADEAGLSKWHFHRTFLKVTGMTPGAWAKQHQRIMANNDSAIDLEPMPPIVMMDFGAYSPMGTSVTASTPLSFTSSEEFDQLLDMDMPEEEWLKMVDFNAISEIVDLGTFPV